VIWIKRILPLIVLVALVAGYFLYDDYRSNREARFTDRLALVSAQIWVARVQFKDRPQQYEEYRDSVLASAGLTAEEIDVFTRRWQSEPERYSTYARLVAKYVDSLVPYRSSPASVADSLGTPVSDNENL
jgi:hypothetical protein